MEINMTEKELFEHERDSYEKGRLHNDIYLISRGVRECAWDNYLEKWDDWDQEYAEMFGIKHYTDEDNWTFLYKRPHQLKMFLLQQELSKQVSKGANVLDSNFIELFVFYIRGKLLGYSEESMEQYFKMHFPDMFTKSDKLAEAI